MKLNPSDTPRRRKKPNGYWFKTLSSFMDGLADCVEISFDDWEYKDVRSLQATVLRAIKLYKFPVTTCSFNGKLYLMKIRPE